METDEFTGNHQNYSTFPQDGNYYMKKRIKEMGLSRKIRINIAGCLDQCRLGPTMVIYPQAIWYTYKNKLDIDDIIEQHLIQGKVIERLLLSR